MRRGVLLLSTVLIALAVAPAAIADKPTREIVPGPDDVVFTGQCGFPVLAHIEGVEIHTTFTDKQGNVVKLLGVFPGNTLTLTNLDTGKSVTLPATGALPRPARARRLDHLPGDGYWALDHQPHYRRAGDLVPARPSKRHVRRGRKPDLDRILGKPG